MSLRLRQVELHNDGDKAAGAYSGGMQVSATRGGVLGSVGGARLMLTWYVGAPLAL